jgi:sugar lactone lactonase YvrE
LLLACGGHSSGGQGGDAAADVSTVDAEVCPANMGDCDGNLSNGCETNLLTDPANCGKCSYSCGSSTCTSGACVLAQPGSLTYTFGDFQCITTDGTNIYFMAANVNGVAGSDILYVPVGGGTVTQLPNATGNRGAGLIASGNFIYWADYAAGTINETPKAGQSGSTRAVVTGLTQPLRVAVDAQNVYWTSTAGAGAAHLTNGASVWTTNQTGGKAWGLAIDNSNVFYADFVLGEIVKVDIGTGSASVFAPNQPAARGLSSDASNIYWTTSSGNVMMSPKSAVNATPIVGMQTNPQEIAADASATPSNVYWGSVSATGNVSKAPATSGATATLISGSQANVQCVALDSTSVYWADYGGTKLLKAPK